MREIDASFDDVRDAPRMPRSPTGGDLSIAAIRAS